MILAMARLPLGSANGSRLLQSFIAVTMTENFDVIIIGISNIIRSCCYDGCTYSSSA